MTAKPEKDTGQKLPSPEGRVIGFVDSRAEFQAVSQALRDAGYPDSKITVLQGEDGLRLLEPEADAFEFGEAESRLMDCSMDQLKQGHYRIEIEVANRDEAIHVAQMATQHGAHTIGYYGSVVSELLTK